MRRLEVGVVALVLAVLTAVVSDVEMGLAAVASVVGGVLVHADSSTPTDRGLSDA